MRRLRVVAACDLTLAQRAIDDAYLVDLAGKPAAARGALAPHGERRAHAAADGAADCKSGSLLGAIDVQLQRICCVDGQRNVVPPAVGDARRAHNDLVDPSDGVIRFDLCCARIHNEREIARGHGALLHDVRVGARYRSRRFVPCVHREIVGEVEGCRRRLRRVLRRAIQSNCLGEARLARR